MRLARCTPAVLLALAALVGCSPSADQAASTATSSAAGSSSAASSSTSTTSSGTASPSSSATGSETGTASALMTCGEWRKADRATKSEVVKAYLASKGRTEDDPYAISADIDIDVYCAGDQHTDESIEPGFKG